MHDAKSPPGHPLGDGEMVCVGDGEGVVDTGIGAEYVPLVTQPPQLSPRGESTALFNQHSLLA